jgi:D-glycero-D-manno-heptose 1,7-bisphosphate phosphatase
MDEHGGMREQQPKPPFVDPRLGADLLWRDVRVAPFSFCMPALFLDRDGVIIEEKKYISEPRDVSLLPGLPDLIREARELGVAIVAITNQAGIGRGYFGWSEFVQVENRVTQVLAEQGAELDAVLACPFHPDARPPYRHPSHPWRKPNPGMLLEAARLLNLDLARSMLVGDKTSDQEAARAAGLAGGIQVLTGYGREQEQTSRQLSTPHFTVRVVARPQDAIPLLAIHSGTIASEGGRN